MPIRPENKARYPANWKEIRNKILHRANGMCEWAECGAINHSMRQSMAAQKDPVTGELQFTMIKVVLTIAHLNHVPEDCRDENLMAMCQKHHNQYDAQQRAINRKLRKEKEMAKVKVNFVNKPGEEVPAEIIASSIQHISESMKKLKSSRLNDRAILVLLKDLTSLPGRDIKLVIDSISQLEEMFLKKKV